MKYMIRLSGEILLKSNRVKEKFCSTLKRNLVSSFKSELSQYSLRTFWSYFLLECQDNEKAIAQTILEQTFGISSFSPIDCESTPDFEDIVATGLAHYKDSVANRRFAIKANRQGKNVPFTSIDVNRRLGHELNKVDGSKVDLTNPEIKIRVNIDEKNIFFHSQKFQGPGGMPLGTGGSALCLMSGGFDSPVAAWAITRRGVTVDYLYCNISGPLAVHEVFKIAQKFAKSWQRGYSPKLYIADFFSIVEAIKTQVNGSYAQVVLKRFFLRCAEEHALKKNALAIITGDVIAQVSSQTLWNINAINQAAVKIPVLRPLIGYDKEQIMGISRQIGLYDLCVKVKELCQIVPDRPVTHVTGKNIDNAEKDLDINSLVHESLKNLRVYSLDQNNIDWNYDNLFVSNIEAHHTSIDCRSLKDYDKEHLVNALHWEEHGFHDDATWVRDIPYVLYCSEGILSALYAERLQNKGVLAFSLKGGYENYKKLEKTPSI